MTGPLGGTEQRLRDALGTLADGVEVDPGAYRRVRAEWRRRERVRRLLLLVLLLVVVACADAIGLWVVNSGSPGGSLIFDDRPGQRAPAVPGVPPAPPGQP